MERDPRLLDLKLAAKYPSNYSYPVRQHTLTPPMHSSNQPRQQHRGNNRESVGSESSNPGMVVDHSSDSDVEMDVEDDFTYHEHTNQLWDTFWTSKNMQGQASKDKYPALMASPGGFMAHRRAPPAPGASPYRRGNLHIVSSSVDSIDESPASHGATSEWPLPPRGLNPAREQHSRPHRSQGNSPVHPTANYRTSPSVSSTLPLRTISLSPQPPSPTLKSTPHASKPAGLSLFPRPSTVSSHSAPVTPAINTSASGSRTTSAWLGPVLSRSTSRSRANAHEIEGPSKSRDANEQAQKRDIQKTLRPNSRTLPKSVSTPNLKNHTRPKIATTLENGTRAPYYQEVTQLSSFPPGVQQNNAPSVPSLSSRSTTNLSIIASYMSEDVPPVPSLTSSFSSISSTQNVSVWEDDSADEEEDPKPSGLSRILNPGAHKRSSSKDHKRASSRDGRESAMSNAPAEPKAAGGRKRVDTMFGRMLGRRSR
ncbi:hypothetical protein MKZ38_000830 [Zalerion maritima]|uniref:Uncharacterized protein n=1 Tax=Zalerion maritima TaxID=339359 RepID=A0AAD5RSL6_9PEZI|nr:hypothetical protein MKZ38_000830 [Zalerion maritima]